jgi:hypothetical protein
LSSDVDVTSRLDLDLDLDQPPKPPSKRAKKVLIGVSNAFALSSKVSSREKVGTKELGTEIKTWIAYHECFSVFKEPLNNVSNVAHRGH